ncbi:MAG: c-type cytochrome [Ramlibacter sp.]
MKLAHLILALLGAGLIAGCADLSRSRDLANPKVPALTLAQQICSNCHGIGGVTISPNFPNLAAQTPAYITAELKQFKSHNRQDPAGFEYMWGLSRSFTDEQIAGLAAYFSSLPPAHGRPEGDEARRKAGDTIFHEGVAGKNVPPCMACHGNQGQGNEGFPRLAGQHADYVIKQLIVFQRTDERPEGAIMKTVAHELSEDDIRNVAGYVQSMESP